MREEVETARNESAAKKEEADRLRDELKTTKKESTAARQEAATARKDLKRQDRETKRDIKVARREVHAAREETKIVRREMKEELRVTRDKLEQAHQTTWEKLENEWKAHIHDTKEAADRRAQDAAEMAILRHSLTIAQDQIQTLTNRTLTITC